ncbi:MAG TPA: GNAT family N-acetyltransferase [Candidatus Limnocylindrales bacterium]|nr:GNAT family N-acetyltransferase [Candidatus Limnocylindrales bacterium]
MIAARIELTDAPAVPGLLIRPFDPTRDYPAIAAVIREADLEDSVDYAPSPEQLAIDDRTTARFDARLDRIVAEVDGILVATASVDVRTREGTGVHFVEGYVRPAWRRRGLGRALLHWTEARALAVARVDGRPPNRALMSWPDETQVGGVALYESEGYLRVRHAFQMVRNLSQPIPELHIPPPLEVRPVVAADHRRIWDADTEAFQDHWNPSEPADDDFTRWFANPDLDTSLWQVAWDGDEVAGSVMSFIYRDENAALGVSRGWFDHISVRRPWRRRGLASALMVGAMRALRDRGVAEAALGVDAESLTGALGVYEALGFRRVQTSIGFRKTFVVD